MTQLKIAFSFILTLTLFGLCPLTVNANTDPNATPTSLFVQEAASGTLNGTDNQHLTLTLKRVRNYTTAYTDRPYRDAVDIRNEEFFDAWTTAFAGDPPNAALSYRLAGEARPRTVILKLTSPKYDAKRLSITYQAALVHENIRDCDQRSPARLNVFHGRLLAPALNIDGADTIWAIRDPNSMR